MIREGVDQPARRKGYDDAHGLSGKVCAGASAESRKSHCTFPVILVPA